VPRVKTRSVLRVGVTGGIGSGKSTVCRILAARGRTVLWADEIARDLTENHRAVRGKIRKAFGKAVYRPDGSLDRRMLARIVFTDPAARATLDRIVHPLVLREIQRQSVNLKRFPSHSYLVIEAALIYESGLDKRLDYVVVIDVPREIRIARVIARDRCSRGEVIARMRSQMPAREKLARADFIVANDGTERELRQRVALLDTVLLQIALDPPNKGIDHVRFGMSKGAEAGKSGFLCAL
jgi:dephospho-CoA kinase